ncbi:hypothetical protein BH11MYX1_BH11MYX1_20540 [soil metagenome]
MTVTARVRRAAGRALREYKSSGAHWHLRNARAELEYLMSRPKLSSAVATTVSTLDRDGIAILPVETLVDPALTRALIDEVASRELEAKEQIAMARGGSPTHYKERYRYSLLGLLPKWDASSAFARFAHSTGVSEVANAYYRLEAQLRYYNVWRTFPVTDPPSDSQLWHRDRDDRFILKAFLYLSDVGPDAGPLTYIPGTHKKGHVHLEPEAFKEPGHSNWRTRDDQMERVIPRSRWLQATGSAGTLVFVDTAGFHKGGFSTTTERNVFTCMFTSPLAEDGDLFDPATPVVR